MKRTKADFDALASVLVRACLGQVFVYGEMHADPHPGNLLVTSDHKSPLAENKLQARVRGLEESHLTDNLQKIANRSPSTSSSRR